MRSFKASSFHLLQLISGKELPKKPETESILIFHLDECKIKTLNECASPSMRVKEREQIELAGWLAGVVQELSAQLALNIVCCESYELLGCC